MATTARYYDGENALVHDVSVRTTTNELVIFRLADAGILARWLIGGLVVLGAAQHAEKPHTLRTPRPAAPRPRPAASPPWVPRSPCWSGCSGSPSTTAPSTQHRCCPTACRSSWARACSTN